MTISKTSVYEYPKLRRPIRTKLTIAFLALTIIPVLATAYYNLTHFQYETAKTARENLVELSRSVAGRIDQLLIDNQRTSATLAGEPLAAEYLAASAEHRTVLAPKVYQVLRNYAHTHPDYDAPGLLDINGIVIASLDESLIGKDRSFRDYFQASINGQPYTSGILVGRATGRPGIFLSNPVITEAGNIVGINIVWLKGSTINNIINDISVGEEGIAYLVDRNGVIIAHPESLDMNDLAAELITAQGSGSYSYNSPLDQCNHVVGYTQLEAVPCTVVVDLPEAEFLAPLQRLERSAWSSGGLAAVCALITSFLLAGAITRPLRHLSRAAVALERDRPFKPADIKNVTSGNDEIAYLGRVFSNMTIALRQREERMEHLNAVLRAIRNVNQLLVKEKDRSRLLKGVCDILIETRGYHSSWIALLDESGGLLTSAEAGCGEGLAADAGAAGERQFDRVHAEGAKAAGDNNHRRPCLFLRRLSPIE